MARISGVDLPRNKRVEVSLTYIYGVGLTTSQEILQKTGVDPNTRVKDLSEDEVIRLREVIDRDYVVEGDLRREVQMNIKRLMDIGCYAVSMPRFIFGREPERAIGLFTRDPGFKTDILSSAILDFGGSRAVFTVATQCFQAVGNVRAF